MEIATAVGGALLSSSFQVLFDKLMSSEMLKFARQEELLPQLKKWEKTLKIIEAVLDDAEEKQMTDRYVKSWLAELRDLAYDVEDILDKFSTEALRRKIVEEPRASTSKVRKLIPACCTGFDPSAIKFNVKMGSEIEKITARLQGIEEEQNTLNLIKQIGGRSNRETERQTTGRERLTTSLVNEAKVYGRDKDKRAILDLLTTEASNAEVCVIPIWGMGGLGKTTLAQLVYHDETMTFDEKAWVCVSENFDVFTITKTILDQLGSSDGNDLTSLQEKLKEKLSQKKFLIVLDDVWNVSYNQWTLFCSPLEAGAPGSRIIATTRNQEVSRMMGPNIPAYALQKLNNDDCLSIFAQHALQATNFDAHPNLKEIGVEIVERCKGLPLAAKALGGLLRSKPNPMEWEDILKSKIWDLPEEKCSILPALRLSYHHLPSHLKRCFAYCATFPKDYEFDEEELVLFWMAEGFLNQPKGNKHMEDLGCEYFYDLLSRSFFQQSSGENTRFVMHDLMHDVALHVAGDISYNLEEKLEGGGLSNPSHKKVRHSSFTRCRFDIPWKFEVFYQMKGLRTFLALPLVQPRAWYYLTSKVLHDLLPKLSCLRTLSLSGYEIVDLPTSIGNLKHLRYLNLSYTKIKCLPDSVSNLFNLQSLRLRGCSELTKLPIRIDNLINLCYLDLSDTNNLKEIPLHIGNLASLQIFTNLPVKKCKGLGNGVFRKLSHLSGKLSTFGLDNVVDIHDARAINLKEKYGLKDLELKWSDDFHDSRNEQNELQVLDSLQPHRFLKALKIISYGGAQFPSWISDSSFSNIERIKLCGCRKIKSLPPLGRLPLLRTLFIEGMNEVKRVGPEFYGDSTPSDKSFPSLTRLIFENMLEWEYWSWLVSVEDGAKGEFPRLICLRIKNCPKLVGKNIITFPSVVYFEITECPQLVLEKPPLQECSLEGCDYYEESKRLVMRELPKDMIFEHMHIHSYRNLKHLDIITCPTLESFPEDFSIPNLISFEIRDCENLKSLPNQMHNFTSLQSLNIFECPSIVSFPDGGLPPNLISLYICDCENLKQPISESDLHRLSSLTHFRIWNTCHTDMISFPDDECLWLPTSLTLIQIQNFQNLESLSKGLQHLTSLEQLNIRDCPKLRSLPKEGLPASLGRLEICICPLLEERCVEKKGEYWPLIEHIPCLQIR